MKIAIIVGSLRKESFNRKIANAIISIAPGALSPEIVEIGQLQMYNQDLDVTPPIEWIEFRAKIKSYDGVIFVTPEYNRSIPAVLKNAIDIASRPSGKNSWNGKPGAVVSVTPGRLGAFGANNHLRQVLFAVNVPTMQQPEAYISDAGNLFDENDYLTDESVRKLLNKFMVAYVDWVTKLVVE